jgi:hypothetical protein
MIMKAKLGEIEFEGTPAEIADMVRNLELDWTGNLLNKRDFLQPVPRVEPDSDSDAEFTSEEVAFKAIKRRPLSPNQAILLAYLLKKKDAWATAIELQQVLKYSSSQLSGLFGAFGKRVSGTDGYIDGTSFFELEWDYEIDCYKYRLPSGPLRAVTRVNP